MLGIEVQSTDDGKLVVAIAEDHIDAVGILALRLDEVTVGLHLLECQHDDIVRIEVGVGYRLDVVDMQRVAPDGILTGVGLGRGGIRVVGKGYHLAFLRKHVVGIGILQGIDTVGAGGHTLDDIVTRAVGA